MSTVAFFSTRNPSGVSQKDRIPVSGKTVECGYVLKEKKKKKKNMFPCGLRVVTVFLARWNSFGWHGTETVTLTKAQFGRISLQPLFCFCVLCSDFAPNQKNPSFAKTFLTALTFVCFLCICHSRTSWRVGSKAATRSLAIQPLQRRGCAPRPRYSEIYFYFLFFLVFSKLL